VGSWRVSSSAETHSTSGSVARLRARVKERPRDGWRQPLNAW